MNRPFAATGIGWLIALIVLLMAIVFMVVGKLDYVTGGLIGGVSLAVLIG